MKRKANDAPLIAHRDNPRAAGLKNEVSPLTRELLEAREAEQHSSVQFAILVQSIKDYAIYMLDKAGRIMTWNSGAEVALGGIVNAGRRISEIVDGFRALFAKDDQRQQLVDLNEIIRSVVESLSSDFNDHHVEPRTNLTAKLPHVYGNKSQLQEVISNLISNAIEAMETTSDRSRVLLVKSELRDHQAVAVVVKDSGPGIDKDRLEGIFTTFVSTKQHGMGLGLAISRTIIDYHGGKLTASSDGKDGASFQFVLPIASENKDGAWAELGPSSAGIGSNAQEGAV